MLEHEPAIRIAAFVGVFGVMVIWEFFRPRRPVSIPRSQRWPGNMGIQVANALMLRLIFPGVAVGFALAFEATGTGWLNRWNGPAWLEFGLALLLLDLAIYVQHVVAHRIPWLWRLHRMHHSDMHLDATSALRFHPIEICLSMLWKAAVLWLLGAPPEAVLVFEVLLNAMAMFNHANVRISERLDRALRLFVVTPDMHRIHHSVDWGETNSNFGFNLSCWDRIFGTYREQAQAGQLGMVLGVAQFRGPNESRIDRLLLQPLRSH